MSTSSSWSEIRQSTLSLRVPHEQQHMYVGTRQEGEVSSRLLVWTSSMNTCQRNFYTYLIHGRQPPYGSTMYLSRFDLRPGATLYTGLSATVTLQPNGKQGLDRALPRSDVPACPLSTKAVKLPLTEILCRPPTQYSHSAHVSQKRGYGHTEG